MNKETQVLLIDLVIIPVLKELAVRRGVHGVTKENIEAFTKLPHNILTGLKNNDKLRHEIIEHFADAIDNVVSEAVDALVAVFAANMPGGAIGDDS